MGNVTGLTVLGLQLNVKRIQLLCESFGQLKRIGVLTNPGAPYTVEFRGQQSRIASTLGVELSQIEVHEIGQLAAASAGLAKAKVQGILIWRTSCSSHIARHVVEWVAATGLPATYPDRGFIDVGGLMFYGAALPDM